MEDVLPLALNVRGKFYEAKKQSLISKMISASTARESYLSDSDGSDFSENDDQDMEIIQDQQNVDGGVLNFNNTPTHRTE